MSSIMITADCPNEPCVTDMQLLDLPIPLLVMILQLVRLRHRLGVCTRVCHAFHTAAVAATDSISIGSMSSQAQCDNFLEWLQIRGAGVTCLDISRHSRMLSLACLPWHALRDLNLEGLSLSPGFFSACTSLTKLKLVGCYVRSSPHASGSAAGGILPTQLSVLFSLEHLEIDSVLFSDSMPNPGQKCRGISGSLLSELVQLTCLKLGYDQVLSDAALQHLSALSALQHLELNLQGKDQQQPTAAALTGLQQLPQLTALKLLCVPWAINLHSVPAFTVLTALRVLQLQGSTSVDPAVLATVSQLQQLDVECRDPWDAEGSAAMLAAIGQQQGLIKLKINPKRYWSTPSAAAYSALTASSHLQHLKLGRFKFLTGAWQRVVPHTRGLKKVCRLHLQRCALTVQHCQGAAQPLSEADIQAMASCCPSLVHISLGLRISSATPFQHLTGLTALCLRVSFQDSASSLAQLTGLQELLVDSNQQGDRVTVSGLLQLTVLQRLRYIWVSGAACARALAPLVDNPSRHKPTLIVLNKPPEEIPLMCGCS